MKKSFLIKICASAIVLLIGLIGFSCSYQSEMRATYTNKTPEKVLDATGEIADFKSWTMVNKKPSIVHSQLSSQCDKPT